MVGIYSKIKDSWESLTGSASEFPLENRLFNSACVIALVAFAYHVPFNYFVGLPLSALVALVLLLIQAVCYYLSRFKGKVVTSIIIMGLSVYVLFGLNYYYNSGIQGPTLLLFALSFFLIIAIAPGWQYKWWFILNLVIVGAILISEYYRPNLVHQTYNTRFDRFADISSSYIVVIVLIYYGTAFLVKSYREERNSAEQKAEELEKINAEKNKLFTIISHDIRAPLSSIQNYLELLSEDYLEEEERLELSKELLSSTRRTQEMLMNILSWSKTQLDGASVNLDPVELYSTLQSTIDLCKSVAHKKGIEIKYHISDDITILADKDMLQLIVRNLINNAIKFTRLNGQIEVTVRAEAGECKISIKDNGIGIKPERQKDLFSLKAKSTYGTGQEKGIGLGLVLCKEFTEIQNGKIWFESSTSTGTCFFVSFPLVENNVLVDIS